MERLLLLMLLLFNLSCKKEDPITFEDECPACTSMINLNGSDWSSKPLNAYYQIENSKDTFFTIGIDEMNPVHDNYRDHLLFWQIPFQEGEYPFDSISNIDLDGDVEFIVFEGGYDSPSAYYLPVFNGESVITVDHVNPSTGEVEISFDLFLYPFGSPFNPSNNSTYSNLIEIHGTAYGILKVH